MCTHLVTYFQPDGEEQMSSIRCAMLMSILTFWCDSHSEIAPVSWDALRWVSRSHTMNKEMRSYVAFSDCKSRALVCQTIAEHNKWNYVIFKIFVLLYFISLFLSSHIYLTLLSWYWKTFLKLQKQKLKVCFRSCCRQRRERMAWEEKKMKILK